MMLISKDVKLRGWLWSGRESALPLRHAVCMTKSKCNESVFPKCNKYILALVKCHFMQIITKY